MTKPREAQIVTAALSLGDLSDLLLYPEIFLAGQQKSETEIEIIRTLGARFKTSRNDKSGNLAKLGNAEFLQRVRALATHYKKQRRGSKQPVKTYDIDRASVAEILHQLNPAIKIINIAPSYIMLASPKLTHLPLLPKGYGFKGGAARLALANLLGQSDCNARPRDLDLLKIGKGNPKLDQQLAQKIMAEDYRHGAEIETLQNIKLYFTTRDLTINQIALLNKIVFCSYQALQDMLNRILQTTPFVTEDNDFPQGRITMKALRLKAESQRTIAPFQIVDQRFNPNVKPFDIALHLERSLQQDLMTAQYYLAECIRHGYLKLDASDVEQAVSVLRTKVPGRLNQFTLLKRRKKAHVPTKRQIGLIRAIR